MRIIFNNNTMRTGPSEDERYQYTNFSDLQKILDNNVTATPGEGPLGNVTPTLPGDVTAAPGEGPLGNVTPTLPGDVIAAPGQGPLGNVTPTVPSSGVTIIPIIPVVRYGYIKFFNSNSSGESIDIYINGTIAVSNLKFREYTEYFSGTAGNYRITVYSAGKRNRKLFERFFRIVVNRKYTGVFQGDYNNFSMNIIENNCNMLNSLRADVRFINTAPNPTLMDIYVDGSIIIRDFYYNDISDYLTLSEGFHNVTLTVDGTMRVVVEEPQLYFSGGSCYGLYVSGNNNTIPIQLTLINERL